MIRILSAVLIGSVMFAAAPASAAPAPIVKLKASSASTDVGYYAPRRPSRCYDYCY